MRTEYCTSQYKDFLHKGCPEDYDSLIDLQFVHAYGVVDVGGIQYGESQLTTNVVLADVFTSAFVAMILFMLGLMSFLLMLILLVISAVIGRKSAPVHAWKRGYALIAVVMNSFFTLYLISLTIIWFILDSNYPTQGEYWLLSASIMADIMGIISLLLAVRILRRNPSE
jgi:hypothetical protein